MTMNLRLNTGGSTYLGEVRDNDMVPTSGPAIKIIIIIYTIITQLIINSLLSLYVLLSYTPTTSVLSSMIHLYRPS